MNDSKAIDILTRFANLSSKQALYERLPGRFQNQNGAELLFLLSSNETTAITAVSFLLSDAITGAGT